MSRPVSLIIQAFVGESTSALKIKVKIKSEGKIFVVVIGVGQIGIPVFNAAYEC